MDPSIRTGNSVLNHLESICQPSLGIRQDQRCLFIHLAPLRPAFKRDKGCIKIETAMTMEDTGGYPRLDSLFGDALETVFCYKDFRACIVRENGAIAGYDRIRPG